MNLSIEKRPTGIFNIAVIVAALGYFVDIYDLLLFTVVKKESMMQVGATEASLLADSSRVINWQMIGLLLGGIFWGMLADKKGRLSVLFGSIILYSIANIFTSYVHSVDQYALWRFVAGLGLAGELGAGITLVSELLPKSKRGIGTSVVAGIGIMGAVASYFTYRLTKDWRLCYRIGGGLGIVLLILRISVAESGMFLGLKKQAVQKGNFLMFFTNGRRFRKYLMTILIGLPTWFVIGILINQSDRFAKSMYGSTTLDSGRSIMFAYAAISITDFLSGFLCQWLQSRKKALFVFFTFCVIFGCLFFSSLNNSDASMYLFSALIGSATGFWAIFVTVAAEQFGTNLRGTAATTAPNMVRGALPLMNLLFLNLFQKSWGWTLIRSGITTGIIVMLISFTALYFTDETYHKDLNYIEH
jgi:MFS transporter, putative metabolite:H+ symporter